MILTPKQSAGVATKTGADVVELGSTMDRRLAKVFGKNTFFRSKSGVFVVEPTVDAKRPGRALVKILRLASWSDRSQSHLKALDPEIRKTAFPVGV